MGGCESWREMMGEEKSLQYIIILSKQLVLAFGHGPDCVMK